MRKDYGKLPQKALTEVELELMTILWRLGEGSVNDVLAELPPDRKLAYTSVSTMLRILEQKRILGSRKEARAHIYIPRLSKAEYEAATIKNVVAKVFDGAPVAMVRQLLDTSDMTEGDLAEIRRLIEARSRSKS